MSEPAHAGALPTRMPGPSPAARGRVGAVERTWWQQTWVSGLLMAVFFAVGIFGISFIITPELSLGVRALMTALAGAAYGVAMGLWLGRTRRGYGRLSGRREFVRAVRSGSVPAEVDSDADIAEWRRALLHHRAQHRPLRWTGPVLFGTMSIMSLGLAATGQPVFWIATLGFTAAFVLVVVTTPRVFRRTEAMLAELDRREGVREHA